MFFLSLLAILSLNFTLSCSDFKNRFYNSEIVVTKIIDGDTIDAHGERIRILGMDTPETYNVSENKPTSGLQNYYGTLAKNFTSKLVLNQKIKIERFKKDKYKRQVARIKINNLDLATQVIKEGLAKVAYISSNKKSPFYFEDKAYVQQLYETELEAKFYKKGFWIENKWDLEKIFPKK